MDDIKSIFNERSESNECKPNVKDRLCVIAASGESKKYLGKDYTIKEIEAMSPKDQEKLFNLYEVKFGKEIVKTLGYSILSLYSRLLGIATPIDLLGFNVNLKSEEALTKDLNDDPIISQTMGHLLTEVCYKYGVYLSPLTAMLITTKHLELKRSNVDVQTEGLNYRELVALDKSLQTVKGELILNQGKLDELDELVLLY